MRAEGAGEPRITFSLPALLQTRALFLHIEGETKKRVLDDARLGLGAAEHYPVRAVLAQTRTPVSIYWCP
jgi:6-phosphogluconolactonase